MMEEKRELENTGKKIRRLANRNELLATSRTRNNGWGKRVRNWWFADMITNVLESPEDGLDDVEAINWLYTDAPQCSDCLVASESVEKLKSEIAELVHGEESEKKPKDAFKEWLFSPPLSEDALGGYAEVTENKHEKVLVAESITFSTFGIFIDEKSMLERLMGVFQLAQMVCGSEIEAKGSNEIWLPENKVLEMLGIPTGDVSVITGVLSGNKIIDGCNHIDFNIFCFLLLLSEGPAAMRLKEYVAIGGPERRLKFDISVSVETIGYE